MWHVPFKCAEIDIDFAITFTFMCDVTLITNSTDQQLPSNHGH